jgi:hypothetical protein
VTALVGAVMVLAPGVALACPSCATRESGGATLFVLLAGMIAVPYVIAAITIKVFRKLERSP